ncbi:uncharacterized protein LOC133914584 [Phragmites australis]|uniref:uncharacterized protein LOC133914584 n=1 Tax=Phragmites australis TaxID=29695 RepID=UPI002D7702E2|nr:uncharacterized protein LOC133914584 [Phragmites australis]
MPKSRLLNEEGVEKVRKLMVRAGQRGASVVTPATHPPTPRGPGQIVIFASFVAASLVPPFSTFFMQVLDTYVVQLAHLSPNSVVILAVFAHLCEMFIGVSSSMALFRHFFILRAAGKKKGSDDVEVVGCCNFLLREGAGDTYIQQSSIELFKRCVHQSCIPAEHRTALIQPVDVENFLSVDCYPTLRSKNGGSNLGLNLEAYARDPTSVAGGNAVRKAVELKSASKRGKDVLALAGIGGDGSDGRGSGDPALLDEELALQLHLAMNRSQRISRSGNSSGGGSTEQDKGKKDVVGGRKGNGAQDICETNMMAQLDDEAKPGCNMVSKGFFRRFDPSVTVVLALNV